MHVLINDRALMGILSFLSCTLWTPTSPATGSIQDDLQDSPRVQVVASKSIVGSVEGTALAEVGPVAGAGLAWDLVFPAGTSADPAAWIFLATAIAWEADFAGPVHPGEDKER